MKKKIGQLNKKETKEMEELRNDSKRVLKKRKDVRCSCKKQKSNEKDRVKYGACRCDSFSWCHTVGIIISNSLYQYKADAQCAIKRDDFELIEKHADAIREYAETDSWDKYNQTRDENGNRLDLEFERKERAFREAMFWLQENWHSLWW